VAEPLEKAAQQLRDLLGEDSVQVSDGGLTLAVEPDRAGGINASLVAAGITVTELRRDERDLEDTFLELTGGKSHVG
jgi:ABC-2 type transport system ATP-binding protein